MIGRVGNEAAIGKEIVPDLMRRKVSGCRRGRERYVDERRRGIRIAPAGKGSKQFGLAGCQADLGDQHGLSQVSQPLTDEQLIDVFSQRRGRKFWPQHHPPDSAALARKHGGADSLHHLQVLLRGLPAGQCQTDEPANRGARDGIKVCADFLAAGVLLFEQRQELCREEARVATAPIGTGSVDAPWGVCLTNRTRRRDR